MTTHPSAFGSRILRWQENVKIVETGVLDCPNLPDLVGIDVDMLLRFSEYFEVSIDYLIRGKEFSKKSEHIKNTKL